MASVVTRQYANFLGLDLRGDDVNLRRSPDCMNVWRDYREIGGIRTRPGMKKHTALFGTVHGIYFLRGEMLAHCGTGLYSIGVEETVLLGDGLADQSSQGFVYDSTLYLLDGEHYLCYDGKELKPVEGYVPTTYIGRSPSGGGSAKDDANLLSDYRVNSFLGDKESVEFYLDTEDIDTDFTPVVTVDGDEVAVEKVDAKHGVVILKEAPGAPMTVGQDNVFIRYKRHVAGYAECIRGCTMAQIFDNRVFVSGNPEHPNTVWHCSLDDPTYFSDEDHYDEGLDPARVTGMVAGNNALWVFREPSDANTTVYYHTPTLDADYGKIYPSCHSSVTTGCVGKAINFNDDIVFFSDRGMEGINGDITTEQVVAHRSSLVDSGLTAEPGYRQMILEEWRGYLLVIIGRMVYLADSRAAFDNGGHMEYEWFRWQLNKEVTCTKVQDGVLYLGTEGGIYTLSSEHNPVESWWVTPKDQFGYPHRLKTTNKRGSVAEATGQVEVQAKTDKSGFAIVANHDCVEDYFTSRIKLKKFKDVQLKIYSPSRFSLESVTLECFIGGYIKR
ncbi:MAG: hypothetical protein IJB59_09510 [Oscillospiraceae bacterium]|nr:hypothetical protein [Oscillospiraceae bacterium]